MIEWYSWALAGIAAVAGLVCLVAGASGRLPGDVTVGAIAIVEAGLLANAVIAIVAPLAGNPPVGDAVEFWVYLVTAILIPPAAVFWGLVERTRWSTVILGIAALAVAVMVVRMQQVWAGHAPFIQAGP